MSFIHWFSKDNHHLKVQVIISLQVLIDRCTIQLEWLLASTASAQHASFHLLGVWLPRAGLEGTELVALEKAEALARASPPSPGSCA